MDKEKAKLENDLLKRFKMLLDFKAPEVELKKKEFNDLLNEKSEKGELKDGKISFPNKEAYDYFSKLASDIGIDVDTFIIQILEPKESNE